MSDLSLQVQQAQSQLSKDGVPYRLGRVSLNLKTLVTGNSLTLPTLSLRRDRRLSLAIGRS